MDMDSDIPLPDELEWLEANNSNFQDDFFDDEDPRIAIEHYVDDNYEEEEPDQAHIESHCPRDLPVQQSLPKKPVLSIPSKPANALLLAQSESLSNVRTNKKRFRFSDPYSATLDDAAPLDDKRSRVTNPNGEIEEDWLPSAPPPPQLPRSPLRRVEEKILSKYASEIDGDWVPITGLDGKRVYAKICGAESESMPKQLDFRVHSNGIIKEPFSILMERVENASFTTALQASADSQTGIVLHDSPVVNEQLWVDKYAPSSFTELLSDEQTNREVLLWLKQWDSCVFGSEIKSTRDDVLSALRRHTSFSQHQKHHGRSYLKKNTEFRLTKGTSKLHDDSIADNTGARNIQEHWNAKPKGYGPPEQKILLLCGPPGLGKTTLAHVAATHCGYLVVEINASDDRSSSAIEAKIHDVVQMNSVMADSKPKCLVIDEIDGALGDGKGAVDVILKMLSSESKTNGGKENGTQEEKPGRISSKRKRNATKLLRPVICICNDLYAPALRPLRNVAKIHMFVQPTANRVVSRLKYICNKEGLRTSSTALTALVRYTECDIRSCLNTLQFLNRRKENLNELEISSQVVGRKDTSKSAFDIWREIFQKKRTKHSKTSVSGCRNISSEFDDLHFRMLSRGDNDVIWDGIYENILRLHYHDPVMRKTDKCYYSLEASDIVNQYVMRTQHMSLRAYQPYFAISIHSIIAQVQQPNLEWPKSYQRHRTTLMEKMEILNSWHNKMPPYISRHLSVKSFVEDSISLLLHILSPPNLKPVASNFLSEKEKIDLAQLVNTMVSYSITYKNIKSDSLTISLRHEVAADASVLAFDPPIGNFINFKGYKSDHVILAMAVKQVLVHEVEKQKILLGSINRSIPSTEPCYKGSEHPSATEKDHVQSSKFCAMEHEPKMLAKSDESVSSDPRATGICSSVGAKVKSPEKTKKPSSDLSNFFDRFRRQTHKCSPNSNQNVKSGPTAERHLRPLLFKFNEGFTNAVKRPVRMREFIM